MKPVAEKDGNKLKRGKALRYALCGVLMVFVALVILMIAYLSIYYHADGAALKLLETESGDVEIQTIEGGYFVDGEGTMNALIFYPGAKVEEEAYLPLLYEVAKSGVDCFLLDMPMRMAMLDMDACEDVMTAYDYDNWYLCGHSLGGAVSAMYAADHPFDVDGLILLAAYSTGEMEGTMRLLSIFGENDGVLNMERYEEGKAYWPEGALELRIEGGNHAWFGDYGEQKGDGKAVITHQEQQRITADAIVEFVLSSADGEIDPK